jgi:hypothetical protein
LCIGCGAMNLRGRRGAPSPGPTPDEDSPLGIVYTVFSLVEEGIAPNLLSPPLKGMCTAPRAVGLGDPGQIYTFMR